MDDDQIVRNIIGNQARLMKTLLMVDRLERKGHDPVSLANLLEAAAGFAWFNRTGQLGLYLFEDCVRRVGEKLRINYASKVERHSKRIGYYMTRAYNSGGHTPIAARLCEALPEYEHVVLIRYESALTEDYDELRSRNNVTVVNGLGSKSAVDSANRIIQYLNSCCAIIAVDHPNDISIGLAAANGSIPKVIKFDHADHVFWTGGCSSDFTLTIRDWTKCNLYSRRAIRTPSSIVPMMLPGIDALRNRVASRKISREILGLDESATVGVIVADAYKLADSTGVFLKTVDKCFRDNRSLLYIVGCNASELPVSEQLSNTRFVGRIPGIMKLIKAFDIYIDSFPIYTGSATLEAVNVGVPTLSWRDRAGIAILGENDLYGVPPSARISGSITTLESYLSKLLSNTEELCLLQILQAEQRKKLNDAILPRSVLLNLLQRDLLPIHPVDEKMEIRSCIDQYEIYWERTNKIMGLGRYQTDEFVNAEVFLGV